tara:strand:+ start:440 stop:634 length:195 start_codon:yes stop_codon:yes gene_type:complete
VGAEFSVKELTAVVVVFITAALVVGLKLLGRPTPLVETVEAIATAEQLPITAVVAALVHRLVVL